MSYIEQIVFTRICRRRHHHHHP